MIEREKLELIDRVNREIPASASTGPDAIWRKFIDIACSVYKCEAGSFFAADDASRMLTLKCGIGKFSQDITNISFSYEGIAGWCAQNRKSVLVNNVQQDPRFCNKVDSATGFTTKVMACVPAVSGVSLLGVIELINPAKGVFTEEDRLLLDYLCAETAKSARSSVTA